MRTIEEVNADIAAIELAKASARAQYAAEEARLADLERAKEQTEAERIALIEAQCASLARDLGNGDAGVAWEALRAKCVAVTSDTTRLLFTPLFRLANAIRERWREGGPNAESARESRHCLAAIKLLPPVRRDDAAFGADATLRAAIPQAEKLVAGETIANSRYLALVAALGLALPREMPPDAETRHQAIKRIGPKPITVGMFPISADPDARGPRGSWKKHAAVQLKHPWDHEIDLVTERYEIARRDRRAEYQQAVVRQRAHIIEAIDLTLADLPLGEAWFWTRHLRRTAAGEKHVRILDDAIGFDMPIEKVFTLARAAGARITLSPSRK